MFFFGFKTTKYNVLLQKKLSIAIIFFYMLIYGKKLEISRMMMTRQMNQCRQMK